MAQRKKTPAPLLPVQLTQVVTTDGVTLSGIVIEPKRKKTTAIIFVHGLNSAFTSGHELTRRYSEVCQRSGYGFFKFNNRGHDIVSRAGKKLGGGGFEKFTDCVQDIEAVIALARRRGFKRMVLMGHSTGSNKALYYTYRRPKKIDALILTGPLSDIGGMFATIGKAATNRLVIKAKLLAKRDPKTLMTVSGVVLTAERCLSLYEPGHAEDTFPAYRQGGWKELHSVRCPLLVVVGEHDQYLDRPAEEHLSFFEHHARQVSALSTACVDDTDHSFHGKEHLLVSLTEDWLRSLR